MTDPIADRLPADLRAALQAELDPGETLRWCDRPLPSRMYRRAIMPAVAAAAVVGVIGTAFFVMSLQTFRKGGRAAGPDHPEFYPAAPVAGIVLSSAVLLGALACLSGPWLARAKALRTVYALTNSRVMTLVRSRSGRIDAHSVEPGHPLSIFRREHGDGSGDIVLYPRPESSMGTLSLIGTPAPREVERLIRTTFDPPAIGR